MRLQQLHEGLKLGAAALRRGRETERRGLRVVEQGMRGGRRAEVLIVGTREDDRRERPQHRARHRRDHDMRIGIESRRRQERGLLQSLVDPIAECGEPHHGIAGRACPRGAGLGAARETQCGERLPAGIVILERGHRVAGRQRGAQRRQPCQQRLRSR